MRLHGQQHRRDNFTTPVLLNKEDKNDLCLIELLLLLLLWIQAQALGPIALLLVMIE